MTVKEALPPFYNLVEIVARLRSPDGCPWDKEQTHKSLGKYLLEECYEALWVLDEDDFSKLNEELGDILLQIILHSQIASEDGDFTIDEVISGLSDKLIRRHPHVFGDVNAPTSQEVEANWEKNKNKERVRNSILQGVPPAMPALAYGQLIHRRAANAGFDWTDIDGVLSKLVEEVNELKESTTIDEIEEEFGDILSTLVNVGRKLNLDVEEALRKSNKKFFNRFSLMEHICRKRELDLKTMPQCEQEQIWQEAKGLIAREKKRDGQPN